MDKTYLYTKNFIEKNARVLNQPLTITTAIDELVPNNSVNHNKTISKKTLSNVMKSINRTISNRNKSIFNNQSINQITNQIIKLEFEKISRINESLLDLNLKLSVLVINLDNFTKINELIDELPESKYLLLTEETREEDPLIESIEDYENIRQAESHNQILEEYDKVRVRLIKLNEKYQFAMEKKKFIESLNQKLENSNFSGLCDLDSDLKDEFVKTQRLIGNILKKIKNMDDEEDFFRIINKLNKE